MASAVVLVGLQLAALDHLPDSPVGHLEDPGSLARRVCILFHGGSLPSKPPALLTLGAVKPNGQKYEEWLKSKGRGEDGENGGPS